MRLLSILRLAALRTVVLRPVVLGLVVLGLTSTPAAGEPYSCGPFLLQPGNGEMTVVIDHVEPLAAQLAYWRADGKGRKQTLKHKTPKRHHIFELTGLAAGTRYKYRVTTGGQRDSGERVFRTLPQRPDRIRLIALGDARTNPDDWHAVSQRVFENEEDALFIIGTGDYPSDGSKYDQWVNQFFAPGRDLLGRIPLWPSIGNHERTREYVESPPPDQEPRSHYFSLFELPGNEHWYRVDYQYVTLLIIDSNSQMSPGHAQYDWLLEQLRSDRRRFTLAAFHHPPFTSGPHGRLEADGTPREWPMDQGQRFLVPLFEMYGVDLVLNGHDHLYERSHKDGVYYVVTGGAGAPLYKVGSAPNPYQQVNISVNHYTALDVDNSSITLTAIDRHGEVLDWFTIPVSEQARKRKMRLAADRLAGAVDCRPADADPGSGSGEVECGIANPFGYDLSVTVDGGDSTVDIGGRRTLQVAGGGEVRLKARLEGLSEALARPAWRGRVEVPLALQLTGDDDGIPMASRLTRRIALREARLEVPRMATPEADGDLSEWAALPAMLLDEQTRTVVNEEMYSGDGDMRARVQLAWSPEALHLAIRVHDDALVDLPGRSEWENDSVEIYLDGRPEAERTAAYGDFVSQNILPVLRPVAGEFEGNNAWPAEAVAWAVRQVEGGYTMEASLPFERIAGRTRARAGDTVRFDMMLNDRDDTEGSQSHHRLWSTGGASSNTSGYGQLVLTQ